MERKEAMWRRIWEAADMANSLDSTIDEIDRLHAVAAAMEWQNRELQAAREEAARAQQDLAEIMLLRDVLAAILADIAPNLYALPRGPEPVQMVQSNSEGVIGFDEHVRNCIRRGVYPMVAWDEISEGVRDWASRMGFGPKTTPSPPPDVDTEYAWPGTWEWEQI